MEMEYCKMQLFGVICYLLVLLGNCVYGVQIALRENWKTGIKDGLIDGKHIVDLCSTEPMSKVFNQIYLLKKFIETVDSLASIIQEFNSKTELDMFKKHRFSQIQTNNLNKQLTESLVKNFEKFF